MALMDSVKIFTVQDGLYTFRVFFQNISQMMLLIFIVYQYKTKRLK